MTTDIRHLVCPHCHKVNRVPDDRLASGGNCGAMNQAQISQWLQSQGIR
ncbi:hypothetical protein [Marinobacter changyiensis]|nr:hypothetical protein [Marinobacter changyiensis]